MKSNLLSGSIATHTHWGKTLKMLDGLSLPALPVLDCTEQGEEFIQLHVPDPHIVQDMERKGPQLVCRLHQPLQQGEACKRLGLFGAFAL